MGAALTVEGLGKRYRLGAEERYGSLREALMTRLARPFARRARPEFWALREASFSVAAGEVVGIIGGNGAGKSTLLKILARVTPPSEGRAVVHGRVGSLLEVGTGFHPELTGRENIRLGGAVLGMRPAEVAARFDDIVAFAEVERFLDEPVKRWSSGMQARLAFAVAAHLDAEVLLIDEVLAVGDVRFQRRCLGRMAEVAGSGRTVLFVSHQLGAIRRLCPRCLWIERGRIAADGPTGEVLAGYLAAGAGDADLAQAVAAANGALGEAPFRWEGIRVWQDGAAAGEAFNDRPVEIELRYRVTSPQRGLRVFVDLCDADHDLVMRSFQDDDADAPAEPTVGAWCARATIPADLLAEGRWRILVQATIHDVRMLGPSIPVDLSMHRATRRNRAYPNEPTRGPLVAALSWRTEPA